jgi:peptidoglycan-associated lipoprotein
MRKLSIGVFALALLAGCASTSDTQPAAPVEDGTSTSAGTTTGGATTAGTGTSGISGSAIGGAGAASALRDPNNILSKRSIYFEFDEFVVKDEYKPVVEAHAKYLQANKAARVTLQGNTDERGSREYNIALAQKRADAVKRLMLLLGATEVQIETVSFGKEKPRREGHDEASWAENRRVDIVHAGE